LVWELGAGQAESSGLKNLKTLLYTFQIISKLTKDIKFLKYTVEQPPDYCAIYPHIFHAIMLTQAKLAHQWR